MWGKKWWSLLVLAMTVVLTVSVIPVPSIVWAWDSGAAGVSIFLELLNRVRGSFVEEPPVDVLVEGALQGLVDSLDDPYSTYMTVEELENFKIVTRGTFGGVGIVITEEDGHIVVVAPIKGTPGERAGVRPRDRIIKVDGQDIRGMGINTASQLMRGTEGTEVALTIERDGQTLHLSIVREHIEVNPVESKMLPERFGYVRLTNFNSHAGEQVRSALQELSKQGAKGMILDLRGNPGGLLTQALEVAREFVPAGPVVYVEQRGLKERQVFSSELPEVRWPLVVLVDGASASAAEIVAGAIQDRKAGVLVGEKTFGKATVQDVFPLSNGGAVKLTTGRYLTPSGRSINEEGITPDVVVPVPHLNLVPLNLTRSLQLGKGGLDVAELQERLKALGYSITKVDGIFGPETAAAVRSLQRDADLPATGIVDGNTESALNRRLTGEGAEDVQLKKAIEVLGSLVVEKPAA
ncbi:MAG: S41 family peptidase [Firmicutes bacterium]|jgi:carboxyl-terminal processing protease|nr:S41 family peptidase [Bacillota bacterium]